MRCTSSWLRKSKINTSSKKYIAGDFITICKSFSNFLKQLDPTLHKKFVMEKFKKGHTGRGSVVEEPKFNFEPPEFDTKLNLPFCRDNVQGRTYLESRNIDPNKFYYAERFCEFTNSLKQTFGYIDQI